MSGKLVGQVLDAAEAGQLRHLSRAAFHALIAIAERCTHDTLQGYAHNSRIQAAIYTGNSKRSVLRAVRELKDAGLIRVVERGYRIPNGASRSNRYEVTLPPPPVSTADVGATQDGTSAAPVGATQDGSNDADVGATQGGANDADVGAKYGHVCAKYGHVGAIQGGTLNGSIDGSFDGGRRGCAAAELPPPPPVPTEPPLYCPKHPGGTTDKCGPCGTQKQARKQWAIDCDERNGALVEAVRQAVADCTDCDELAWHLDTAGVTTDSKCQAVKDYR